MGSGEHIAGVGSRSQTNLYARKYLSSHAGLADSKAESTTDPQSDSAR